MYICKILYIFCIKIFCIYIYIVYLRILEITLSPSSSHNWDIIPFPFLLPNIMNICN